MAKTDLGDVFDAGQEEFVILGSVLWNPQRGDRVLDVCCGAGASAIPAAKAVGPDGHVDAVDLAERLLEQGRVDAAGLTQLDFVHADATTWPHKDYDIVQCVYGVFFLPDMDVSADRLVSLLRPGGRFVVTTWAEEAITPVREIFEEAVVAEGGEPAKSGRGLAARINTPDKLTGWPHRAWVARRACGDKTTPHAARRHNRVGDRARLGDADADAAERRSGKRPSEGAGAVPRSSCRP